MNRVPHGEAERPTGVNLRVRPMKSRGAVLSLEAPDCAGV